MSFIFFIITYWFRKVASILNLMKLQSMKKGESDKIIEINKSLSFNTTAKKKKLGQFILGGIFVLNLYWYSLHSIRLYKMLFK